MNIIRHSFYFIVLVLFIIVNNIFSVFANKWVTMNITYDFSTHLYSAEGVNLFVNGNKLENLAMPPIIFNERTLVPAREVFEPMGAVVDWKEDTQEVFIAFEDTIVILKIGSSNANVNGEIKKISPPAKIINGKTMIPVRFVAEAFGIEVIWEEDTRSIFIDSNVRAGETKKQITTEANTETTTYLSIQESTEVTTHSTTQTNTEVTTYSTTQTNTEVTTQFIRNNETSTEITTQFIKNSETSVETTTQSISQLTGKKHNKFILTLNTLNNINILKSSNIFLYILRLF